MSNITIGLILVCALFQNCKEPNNSHSEFSHSDTTKKDRIIPYVEDSTIYKDRQKLFVNNVGKTMGYPSLFNGKNGLYLRIWNWDFGNHYVVNIYNDGLNKGCEIKSFNLKNTDSGNFLVIHDEWEKIEPKSGWDIFFDSLKKYNIDTLQSQKPHKERLTGMAYIQLEVAQTNGYKFSEFLDPSFYRYIDSDAKTVYDLLKYIEREIDVPFYRPADSLFVAPN